MSDEEKSKIHEQVDKYKKENKEIEIELSRLFNIVSFTHYDSSIISDVKEIEKKISQFKANCKKINLAKYSSDETEQFNEFNIKGKEINNSSEEKIHTLRDVKKIIIENYNREISSLKSVAHSLEKYVNDNLSDSDTITQIKNIISKIPNEILSTVNANLNMNNIDLKKVSELNEELRKLRTNLDVEHSKWVEQYLDDLLDENEEQLVGIDHLLLHYNSTYGEGLKNEEDIVNTDLKEFEIKIKKTLSLIFENRSEISEDLYRKYRQKILEIIKNYSDKCDLFLERQKIIHDAKIKNGDLYRNFIEDINKVATNLQIVRNSWLVRVCDNRFKRLSAMEVKRIKQELDDLKEKLLDIKNTIEESKKDGKLDRVLYENLNKMINTHTKVIDKTYKELTSPQSITKCEVYTSLNIDCEMIDNLINELKNKIKSFEGNRVIASKERKSINKLITRIEYRMDLFEYDLNNVDNRNETKEKEMLTSLKKQKIELNYLRKEYAKKCPLLVKETKNIDNFCKKYKKPLLISAGLSSFAITIHPVIIPALISTNVMIGAHSELFNPVMMALNNWLCKSIGAKMMDNKCVLKNGTVVNCINGTGSLIQGFLLASAVVGISGNKIKKIGTTVTTELASLGKKAKEVSLKEELSKEINSVKDNNVESNKKAGGRKSGR